MLEPIHTKVNAFRIHVYITNTFFTTYMPSEVRILATLLPLADQLTQD